MDNLENILESAKDAVAKATNEKELEQIRVDFLGKKGALTQLLKGLGQLSPEERPQAGAKINQVKQEVQLSVTEAKKMLSEEAEARQLEAEKIDISLPGRVEVSGGAHPVTKTIERIED